MDWARLALLGLVGAGITWAAGEIAQRAVPVADRSPAGEPAASADADLKRARPRKSTAGRPAGEAETATATVDDQEPANTDAELPTPEEVEAELERLEKQLEEEQELAEFTPSRPLPADVPIALPSDI